MINKIIIPLDGSQVPEVTLPYAAENAGRLNADIILLAVKQADDTRSQYMLEGYLEKVAGIVREEAAKYQEPGARPLDVSTRVLAGDPAEEIVAFADSLEGSKIAMATHGQSGFARFPIGSVTDKVIRTSSRPVSVVRAEGGKPAVHKKSYLKKILAPMDGSKEGETILTYLEEFARKLKAGVTFLHVLEVGMHDPFTLDNLRDLEKYRLKAGEYMEKLNDSFRQKGIKSDYEVIEVPYKNIGDAINSYTREHAVDTIVMATHGRSGVQRWILGSVALKVLIEGNTPLTLIRAKE